MDRRHRALEIVFWTAAAVVAHGLVGYPAYIWLRSRIARRPVRQATITPTVTCVLAARDEAATILAKLANLAALDYPAARLEIVVVDDGSADGTADVATAWSRSTPLSTTVVRLPRPRGKASALNAGVAHAHGDVVVFVDARQRVAQDAVRRLVRNFADERIGAVSGVLVLDRDGGDASTGGLRRYWSFERWLRRSESASGSTIGCTGALYGVRRALYAPLPEAAILDDVMVPLRVMEAGYRVVVDDEALVFDRLGDSRREFRRKMRTLAGNLQLVHLHPALLSPRHAELAGRFVSHKLVPRVLMPYALLTLLLASARLPSAGYRSALMGQLAVYVLGTLGLLLRVRPRVLEPATGFVVLNAASIAGTVAYLTPLRRGLWKKAG